MVFVEVQLLLYKMYFKAVKLFHVKQEKEVIRPLIINRIYDNIMIINTPSSLVIHLQVKGQTGCPQLRKVSTFALFTDCYFTFVLLSKGSKVFRFM